MLLLNDLPLFPVIENFWYYPTIRIAEQKFP